MVAGSPPAGASIAAAAATCMRWFTTTSRSAPTGIVEVPAVLDAEVLGHRDLRRTGQEVAAPDRLEHRVREPQLQDLVEAHLPEVVVDAVELGLVDVLVELVGEGACGFAIMPEGLLHDHASGAGEARFGQTLDHPAEQERGDLEVEDGVFAPPIASATFLYVSASAKSPAT